MIILNIFFIFLVLTYQLAIYKFNIKKQSVGNVNLKKNNYINNKMNNTKSF